MELKYQIIILVVFSLGLGLFVFANAAARFTNINCTSFDREFADFEYCYLKSYNRSYKYLSAKVKLFKTPVTNVSVRWTVLKRASGYKPFLFNITFDACKFLRSKKGNPIAAYFLDWIYKYSNMNHTCPYNHDLIVEKLEASYLNSEMTDRLPMPRGEYCFSSDWIAYGINRANVRVFLELT